MTDGKSFGMTRPLISMLLKGLRWACADVAAICIRTGRSLLLRRAGGYHPRKEQGTTRNSVR